MASRAKLQEARSNASRANIRTVSTDAVRPTYKLRALENETSSILRWAEAQGTAGQGIALPSPRLSHRTTSKLVTEAAHERPPLNQLAGVVPDIHVGTGQDKHLPHEGGHAAPLIQRQEAEPGHGEEEEDTRSLFERLPRIVIGPETPSGEAIDTLRGLEEVTKVDFAGREGIYIPYPDGGGKFVPIPPYTDDTALVGYILRIQQGLSAEEAQHEIEMLRQARRLTSIVGAHSLNLILRPRFSRPTRLSRPRTKGQSGGSSSEAVSDAVRLSREGKLAGEAFERAVKETFKRKIIREGEVVYRNNKIFQEIDFEIPDALVEAGISLKDKLSELHRLAELAAERSKQLIVVYGPRTSQGTLRAYKASLRKKWGNRVRFIPHE